LSRYTPPKPRPPRYLIEAAQKQACPDCDSDIRMVQDENQMWHTVVAHDDSCVQLAFRQRHGATHSAMLVAQPGHTRSADDIAEFAAVVGEGADRVRVSFGDHPGFDRTERAMFEESA
jgi:hypothetical protein